MKCNQTQEALKMAIEALEQAHSLAFKEIAGSPPDEVLFEDAIQACKEALAQQVQEAQQEPVGKFKLVPIEPTPKMVDATWNHPIEKGGVESHNRRNKRIYKAMIEAYAHPAPAIAQDCQYGKDVGMPEYSCVGKCQYAQPAQDFFERGKEIAKWADKQNEQPAQEPVAWIFEDELPDNYPYDEMFRYSAVIDGVRMFPVFYPAPSWQGLSDDEIRQASLTAKMQEHYMGYHSAFTDFARAIEQALRERNCNDTK